VTESHPSVVLNESLAGEHLDARTVLPAMLQACA
jgi:hypothetical protein